MTSNYKEEQAKCKLRMGQSYNLKECQNKKLVINGELYVCFKEGVRKIGALFNGKEFLAPPEPKNKKERRKMAAGKDYIDKKGTLQKVAK